MAEKNSVYKNLSVQICNFILLVLQNWIYNIEFIFIVNLSFIFLSAGRGPSISNFWNKISLSNVRATYDLENACDRSLKATHQTKVFKQDPIALLINESDSLLETWE